ncbi:hypothetical protein V8F20_004191 [Naviculisporaceae sp. PSN 640]
MPEQAEVSYSHEETVAAFAGFHDLLQKLYLPDGLVIYPPPGGWPPIVNAEPTLLQSFENIEYFERLNKTLTDPDEHYQPPPLESLNNLRRTAEGGFYGRRLPHVMLKTQFVELRWVPSGEFAVRSDEWSEGLPGEKGMTAMCQSIFRKHRWPNLELYSKSDCLAEIKKAMEENYDDHLDHRC